MGCNLYLLRKNGVLVCVMTMFLFFGLLLSAVWADNSTDTQASNSTVLKILSLNLAHGRGTSFSQFFVTANEIRKNLVDIADFLRKESPDIVALQEADAPSHWSGKFDHVEFLAREAFYPWYLHGKHVTNSFGHYGTAIISRLPIIRGLRLDFSPTPPTMRKGFTLAEINIADPNQSGKEMVIDVISVHLDFSRDSKRMEQIIELQEVLEKRKNQKIIMGDFNTSWNSGEELLQKLAHNKVYKTYLPEAENLNTYKDKRLDWILISDCINFKSYRTINGALSDHQAVVSEIVISQEPDCGENDEKKI